MKISDEEVKAALNAWYASSAETHEGNMRHALEAAKRVRKAAKKARKVAEPGPAAPAWNGKFEVGKSYRTHNGQKAIIVRREEGEPYPLRGRVVASWRDDGRWCFGDIENPIDLVGPWGPHKDRTAST